MCGARRARRGQCSRRGAIITESIAAYPSVCACPYSTMRNGHACGGRCAYSRPGGYCLREAEVAFGESPAPPREAGRHDLVVHVVVHDTQHLKDLAFDQFTNRPGVMRIETPIIYDVRRRQELPVFDLAT